MIGQPERIMLYQDVQTYHVAFERDPASPRALVFRFEHQAENRLPGPPALASLCGGESRRLTGRCKSGEDDQSGERVRSKLREGALDARAACEVKHCGCQQ